MEFLQNSEFNPFSFKNGILYCENLEMSTLLQSITPKVEETRWAENEFNNRRSICYDIPSTPVFVHSTLGLQKNVGQYKTALEKAGLRGKIGYAIKANPNINIVKKLKSFGVDMIIAVSGYEVTAALNAGFSPENIILNGNGKQKWEVKLAIEQGVMMNVDSIFDAEQIVKTHRELQSENEVKVLLRARPVKRQTLGIHEYVNTAENSKFGFDSSAELDPILETLRSNEYIQIIGVHCHFGSGFGDPKVYEWLGSTVADIVKELKKREVFIKVLNVGGGIGIDYFKIPPGFEGSGKGQNSGHGIAEISEFMGALSITLPKNMDIILEPGRSLVGHTGILLCKVLGTKMSSNGRKLLVVDGSMNEVIRPCLYGAHHNILPTTVNPHEKWESFDVVGPICESADFLGKQVSLQKSSEYVAVMDCGAYCSSMSSNYNLKPRAAEILVNGKEWTYIRKRDTFQEIIDKMLL